ncbi:Beta-ketoacyl synthase protein, partial [Teladorsagia circumcincta]
MKTGILKKDYKSREFAQQSPALMDVDVTKWDPEFFGVSPREAKYVDVLQRFMMRSVVRCMENAGWTSIPKETGIFIGVSGSDFNNRVYSEVKGDISGYFGVGSSASCVAGRIAHWLQAEGPAMVVDTACSSSFVALTSALDAITHGKCDHAIVGGVNVILHDTITQVLRNAGVLSAKGVCRVFDAGADGYVRSEAVGCILLSTNSSGAEFRITHWAIGHNGKASSLQVPNGSSQERLMRALNSGNIDHVECHGTGTTLGDPIEIRAVSRCYGAATISSIKSLLGHAEAASGIVSLLACLQQMKHNYRAPQSCFTCP